MKSHDQAIKPEARHRIDWPPSVVSLEAFGWEMLTFPAACCFTMSMAIAFAMLGSGITTTQSTVFKE